MSSDAVAQFQINQKCPDGWPPIQVEWPALPLCVWVYAKEESEKTRCGGQTFRIVRERGVVTEDGTHYTINADIGYFPAVCEHMGHLIE